MLLNSREFKVLKNYRNVYGKSSAKREYRDENVSLNVDKALSKLNILLILYNKVRSVMKLVSNKILFASRSWFLIKLCSHHEVGF